MSTKSLGRTLHGSRREFAFKVGDLVLVKWNDGMVYFAKIKRVDHKRRKCTVVFDDKSQDEAHFNQIHSVDETTTDIICIKCKKDDSESPNEIVLCDTCGIGYHQKCHAPQIPTGALNIDTPWQCTYCNRGVKCPYLTESLDVLQNLLSDESDNSESEMEALQEQRSSSSNNATRRSQRGKMDSELRPPRQVPPPVDRRRSPLSHTDSVRYKLASVPVTPSDKPATPIIAPSLHAHTVDTVVQYTPESTPESTTPEPLGERKRKKKHSHAHRKKHKRSSVDTCTLFVTRLPTEGESVTPDKEAPVLNGQGTVPILERRPRSLRVSLSIQDDCDGAVKVKTPSAKSPPQAKSQNDQVFPSVTLVSPEVSPKRKPSVILQTVKTEEKLITPTTHTESKKPSPAFTASQLPSNSIPEFISIDDMFELSPSKSHQAKPLGLVERKMDSISKETQSKDIPTVGGDKPVLSINVQGSKVSVVKLPSTTSSCEDKIKPPAVIVNTQKPLNVQLTTAPQVSRSQVSSVITEPLTTPPSVPVTAATKMSSPPTSLTVIANTTKPNTIVPVHSKPTTLTVAATNPDVMYPPASSVVTTSTPTSSKRPWTDDVIITSVEKQAKKSKVDSPSEPKPPKKDIPCPTRPPLTGMPPPSTVLLSPNHYSPLLQAGHTNKPQYVYCVQSSPGRQPIYFPANMLPPQAAQSKHIKSPSTNSPIYYTNEVVSAAHVNTTKPYAIVNALPTTTGMGMYPRQLGPLQTIGEGSVIVPTQTEKPKTAIHTPSPSCERPDDDLNSHLQTINKNISAAFTNSNEDMLVTAFEDAWKKFQANGHRYTSKLATTPRAPHAPPNAEVVPISGPLTSSRLSLVRPVGPRPRTITPKVHRACARCGRDATYLCSGCRTEWYCGRDCQLKSWDSHSETCKH